MKWIKLLKNKYKFFYIKNTINIYNYKKILKNNNIIINNKSIEFSKKELDYLKEKFKFFINIENYWGSNLALVSNSISYHLVYDYNILQIDLAKLEDDYYLIHLHISNYVLILPDEKKIMGSDEKFLYLDQFSDFKSVINKLIINYDEYDD